MYESVDAAIKDFWETVEHELKGPMLSLALEVSRGQRITPGHLSDLLQECETAVGKLNAIHNILRDEPLAKPSALDVDKLLVTIRSVCQTYRDAVNILRSEGTPPPSTSSSGLFNPVNTGFETRYNSVIKADEFKFNLQAIKELAEGNGDVPPALTRCPPKRKMS
jgi:hypothetical protein